MANYLYDVLRVQSAGATGISSLLRNKQSGHEGDGTFRMGHKMANGTMKYWTPDGYVQATGIGYTNDAYPAVANVAEALDALVLGITGIQAGAGVTGIADTYVPKAASNGVLIQSTITDDGTTVNTGADTWIGGKLSLTTANGMTGPYVMYGSDQEAYGEVRGIDLPTLQQAMGVPGVTGLSKNMVPRVASDGKFIDSKFSSIDAPTGPYGEYEGNIFKVRRTAGSAQYNPAELRIIRDTGVGQRNFEQTRLAFLGQDASGGLQNYGSIRAYSTDPTDGAEAGTVSINVGDSDAEQERLRVTRFGGVQSVYSTPFVVGDSLVEWTTNQCIAFGIPTGAQGATWENDEIGMSGRMFISDVTDAGMTVEGLSNKTSADTALTLIGRCVTTPGSVGAVAVDACTQNGTGATATGIATDSALLAFKNGGTLQPNATVWGDGDVGERYKDIFSQCTFGNGLTGIGGYISAKKIGRTAFFNVFLYGSCTGPLTKTIELPEAYRGCTGAVVAFFSHNCSNAGTWGAGCGYMSSYLEKKIYLTSTPDPNQGLWSGGAFATQFQFFSECQV